MEYKYYRGIIHFHSEYSSDSWLSIKKILKTAEKENYNFLILTDHNTYHGVNKINEYIQKSNLKIEVPNAIEVKTEFGDLIVAFANEQIKYTNINDFIDNVRKHEGLIFLPHPYSGHKNIEEYIDKVDFIEAFNSRILQDLNQKAVELANKFNKKVYYSSDAHNFNEIKNVVIKVKNEGTLKESLLKNMIEIEKCLYSRKYNIIYSRIIYIIKNRDISQAYFLVKHLIYISFNNLKLSIQNR